MYQVHEERVDEPISADEQGLIEAVDEMTINPCPCTQEGKSLEVYVQYASVEFHWKYKQLEYWGDYGGVINIKYCPFCGRKL